MKATYRGYSMDGTCHRYDIDWRCPHCGSEDVQIVERFDRQIYDGRPSLKDERSLWECKNCHLRKDGRAMMRKRENYAELPSLQPPRTVRTDVSKRFFKMTEDFGWLIDPIEFDKPRGLRDRQAVFWKLGRTRLPHVQPLEEFRFSLERKNEKIEYPFFDPDDGGIGADILFLFEKPGPMTVGLDGGSGFISRDNDDPTAEATFEFMLQARIPRSRTLTWNVIPGWNGTRRITAEEHRAGLVHLLEIVPRLSALRTVVLVGAKAQAAEEIFAGFRVIKSPHPSPIVRAANFEMWKKIPEIWKLAA